VQPAPSHDRCTFNCGNGRVLSIVEPKQFFITSTRDDCSMPAQVPWMERSAQSIEIGWRSTWDQNGPAEFASHEARIGYVANTENNIETFIE
jgi:hypothetical protein